MRKGRAWGGRTFRVCALPVAFCARSNTEIIFSATDAMAVSEEEGAVTLSSQTDEMKMLVKMSKLSPVLECTRQKCNSGPCDVNSS